MSETLDVQGGFDDKCRIVLANTPIGSYRDENLLEVHGHESEMARAGEDSKVWKRETVGRGIGPRSTQRPAT